MAEEGYRIYYLGHSAWAVETRQHYLLFDCQNENIKQGSTLEDGAVDLAILSDKPVFIFFSHRHHDHYSRILHEEVSKHAQVSVVLGDFKSVVSRNTTVMHPRETLKLDQLTVHTAASTDEGVCVIVQADGVNIFFSGDNADWGDGDAANRLYYEEIDYLAGLGVNLDLAFIPVCQYSGQRPEAMTQGAFYAIDHLKPALTCPMHANGREALYEAFAADLQASGRQAKVLCAKNKGRLL